MNDAVSLRQETLLRLRNLNSTDRLHSWVTAESPVWGTQTDCLMIVVYQNIYLNE